MEILHYQWNNFNRFCLKKFNFFSILQIKTQFPKLDRSNFIKTGDNLLKKTLVSFVFWRDEKNHDRLKYLDYQSSKCMWYRFAFFHTSCSLNAAVRYSIYWVFNEHCSMYWTFNKRCVYHLTHVRIYVPLRFSFNAVVFKKKVSFPLDIVICKRVTFA